METNCITQIKKAANHANRYGIYVDGEYLFSVHADVFVKYRLYQGMPIDKVQIQALVAAEEYHQVRLAVLRYLSYRPRTEFEVYQYIAGKEFAEEEGRKVVAEMRELGYLNDRAYAQEWVEERRKRKGLGCGRLKRELQRKGIPAIWIEESLTHADEEAEQLQALEVAERRYLRICRARQHSWLKVERKLGQYLLRQGFSSDIVYAVLPLFRTRYLAEEENP
jgi:regulatory protein